jgi:hypothetical protein
MNMETGESILELIELISGNCIALCDVTEIKECREALDHL